MEVVDDLKVQKFFSLPLHLLGVAEKCRKRVVSPLKEKNLNNGLLYRELTYLGISIVCTHVGGMESTQQPT